MMTAPVDLFGMPALDPGQSQYFTPAWLARKLADWVPPTARVCEPTAGSGNLIEPLIRRGHDPGLIVAVERDPRWAAYLRDSFPSITVICGDFTALSPADQRIVNRSQVFIGNPPFEANFHAEVVCRALKIARLFAGIFPVTFESTQERDRTLWAKLGRTSRRAWLPERVDYGAKMGPSFESLALLITRRDQARQPDEIRMVSEETWRPAP